MEAISLRNSVFAAYEHGDDPRYLLCDLLGKDRCEAETFLGVSDDNLWRLAFQLAAQKDEPVRRAPRPRIRDLATVYRLIADANNIVVLIGAGASTGPDFRSPGGLYDTVAAMRVLDDPYDVFDINCFARDPSIFWRVAHLIFPPAAPAHSSAHLFLAELERRGKLLRVYSQNVDTLETGLPDERLRCVHGSWRENHCLSCGRSHSISDLRPSVDSRTVPRCSVCGGAIKPGIVFFGQDTEFDEAEALQDAAAADLLIVIGTSLKVQPIANLPQLFYDVPSVLINRESVGCDFSAELIGDCDDIIRDVEAHLQWRTTGGGAEPVFDEPNRFVFPSSSGLGTTVVDIGMNRFLVSPRRQSGDFC